MDAQEEVMASNSSSSTGECPCPAVVKGKRTKRQRAFLSPPPPPSPSPLPVSATIATIATTITATSSSSSAEFSTTTEEEEDMAHCLILLAQGHGLINSHDGCGGGGNNDNNGTGKFKSRKFTEAATTAGGKAGFYVYECKTCNKCFPSFQALGGHRASHKKPRLSIPPPMVIEEKMKPINIGEFGLEICMNSSSSSKQQLPNSKSSSRIHECSICGSEFSSGQALGGHMRRHRPATVPESPEAIKKERNVNLSLDLNLPAPSDENPNEFAKPVAFAFAGQRPIVFSPSSAALVDCHY